MELVLRAAQMRLVHLGRKAWCLPEPAPRTNHKYRNIEEFYMLTRSLLLALAFTVVASVPLFFLSRSGFTIIPTSLPWLLVPMFVFLSAGNYLSARTASQSPASNPGTRPAGRSPDHDRERGKVKWFNANKGFGFITRDRGDDVFVHFRSIRGDGRRALKDGQRVEFAVVESKKGLQAEDVAVAG